MDDYNIAYVVGDIHGHLKQLLNIQNKIQEDSNKTPGKKLLIYLGDYIDRGVDSKDCINSLINFKPANFDIVYLLGNHEQMLLDFISGKNGSLYLWISNGGLETLQSYGQKMENYIDDNLELSFDKKIYEKFINFLPQEHKNFFYKLKLNYQWGDYYFVHAGIDPGIPLNKQKKQTMLWTRDRSFLNSDKPFEKLIVHGHTPSRKIIKKNNRICLDTGVFYTGILSCAKISNNNIIYFHS